MTIDVISEIDIAASVHEVSTYATDPDNAPNWSSRIESVEWVSQPPLRRGSKMVFVAPAMGRRLAYTYEVVEYAPGRRLVMRTEVGPFPTETTYTWEKLAGDSTRMTVRKRGEPSGMSKLAAPFVRRAMKNASDADLRALKELFEGTG